MNDKLIKEAQELLSRVTRKGNEAGLFSVLIIWADVFGGLSHRVGYFEDYMEAASFMENLDSGYTALKQTFSIYLNGQLIKSYAPQENND